MTAIRELANWIPLTASGVAFFSTMSVLAAWRMYFRRAGSRDPGRAAGQARRDALSQAGLDAAEYAALGLLILPLAAGINAAWWGAARASPAPDALWLLACSALGLQGWTLWRLLGALRRAQRLRDGYDAELVASQELNGLGGLGYYVFHDVPLGERIAKADHVLVGPAGIFAVQTEARAGRGADAEREVTYDGASLCFARHRETAPLERAIARAARLREWLTVETGQSIPVQPVLMLPGWRVRRTDISGIPVLATSRVRHYFSRLRPRMGMSELLIEQVARSLDTRCQGPAVEPAQ